MRWRREDPAAVLTPPLIKPEQKPVPPPHRPRPYLITRNQPRYTLRQRLLIKLWALSIPRVLLHLAWLMIMLSIMRMLPYITLLRRMVQSVLESPLVNR